MTSEEVKNIVGLFYTGHMAVGIFETHYNDGELKLFYQKYAEKDYQALRKFKKVMGDGTPPLYVTDGMATIPSDFFAIESAYYRIGIEPIPINFLEDADYDRLIAHKIEYPTPEYPIGNIQPDYIRILPKAVKFVVFSYLTKPTPITYAVTETRGFIEFDGTGASSTVKWDEANAVLLIQNILQSLGIITNQTEIKSKIQQS